MKREPILNIADNAEALARLVATWLSMRIASAPSRFAFNLSGGSTPKRVYELLGGDDLRNRIDWRKVHLFWGDERFVPFDHPDSNFRMASQAMLRDAQIPPQQIHPIPTDASSPEEAAALYQRILQEFYGSDALDPQRALFDVTLLGLGTDGHTASLFPKTAALDERSAWVTSIIGVKPEPRISMTYPALDSSADVLFLVSGADKKEMLDRLLTHDCELPAARVSPLGAIRIFADRAAVTG
jgi:6-phosphogluconolactonase